MKTKTLTLLLLILGISLNVRAQKVISSDGGIFLGPFGSFSYTLGETVIETLGNSNIDLTQGYQQTGLTIVGFELPEQDPSLSVYPNPVNLNLNIDLIKFESGFRAEILDGNGILLGSYYLSRKQNQIDFSSLSPGIYLVEVWNEKTNIKKIFKIIKS